MPRPTSYAVFCFEKKNASTRIKTGETTGRFAGGDWSEHDGGVVVASMDGATNADDGADQGGSLGPWARGERCGFVSVRPRTKSTLFPYTTLFRSWERAGADASSAGMVDAGFLLNRSSDQIGRAVQQECRDRPRMPSSALKKKTPARESKQAKPLDGLLAVTGVSMMAGLLSRRWTERPTRTTAQIKEGLSGLGLEASAAVSSAYDRVRNLHSFPTRRSSDLGSVLVLMLPLLVWLTPDSC